MSDILEKIETALEELRPFLNEDGGDIAVVEITDDMVLKLEFKGACRSCDINISTLNSLKDAVHRAAPEIKDVEMVNLP